jgi:hypothetical protein
VKSAKRHALATAWLEGMPVSLALFALLFYDEPKAILEHSVMILV